jgi:outer membrane protein OmpA-like peptidoglycan-associated protein
MRRRPVRHLVVAGVAVVATATAGTSVASATTAQEDVEPRPRDVEPRVRDLELRVRDLTYRVNALDNSERVEETPEETSVILAADVLFDYNQAELTPAALERLADLAARLDELGPREVVVGGHTDSDGEDAANQDLSVRRAEAVRAALAADLSDEFTFQVDGHGESRPVAPNTDEDGSDNPEGRALNRRVEITFPS